MNPLRRPFLWASRSDLLARWVPRLPPVRRAVRRFLPGESAEAALDAARELERRGMSSVLTRLGENVADEEEAQEEADHYVRVLEATSRAGLDAEISVKLTHLGLDLDEAMARGHLARLAARAEEHGSFVWVDMESSDYTEATLRLFREVRSEHPDIGVCVQAYLRRSPDDVAALLEEGASLRLVKGAYDEPPSEALQEKDAVDEAFLSLGRRMLEAARNGGPRQAIGTHDLSILSDLRDTAREMDVDEERWELQMLYGIRNRELEAFAERGHRCRVLISYGEEWFPWYMRRLAERPANLAFVLRNLFNR